MDTASVIWGLIIAIITGLVVLVGYEIIVRPKLKFHDSWMRRKWVGKLEKNKFTHSSFVDSTYGIAVTTKSSTSDEGISEDWQISKSESGFFDFYGITINNLGDPNPFIHIKTAEITRTELILDDGQKVECRWWTRDYSEKDKLFPSEGFDIDDRRTTKISAGTFEHLVIAYRSSENSIYSLFDITSDVGNNFWDKTRFPILGFPRYAKLKIFTSAANFEIKLELYLSNDTKNNLLIREIKAFPSLILLKE